MKIALGTVEVTDRHRVALSMRLGQSGLATRDQMRRYVRENGEHALDDLEREIAEHGAELARKILGE